MKNIAENQKIVEIYNSPKVSKAVNKLRRIFKKIPIDDLNSLVLEGIWKCLKKYDVNLARCDFATYLFNYLKWECIDICQKNQRWHDSKFLRDRVLESSNNSEEYFEYLNDPQEIKYLELRLLYKYTWEEMAEYFGIHSNTVQSRYKKIIEKVQKSV